MIDATAKLGTWDKSIGNSSCRIGVQQKSPTAAEVVLPVPQPAGECAVTLGPCTPQCHTVREKYCWHQGMNLSNFKPCHKEVGQQTVSNQPPWQLFPKRLHLCRKQKADESLLGSQRLELEAVFGFFCVNATERTTCTYMRMCP